MRGPDSLLHLEASTSEPSVPRVRSVFEHVFALRHSGAPSLSLNVKVGSSLPSDTAKHVSMVAALTSARSRATADRMILPHEFMYLQRLCGRSFDLDACCNDSGDNSLCGRNFCSPVRSFLNHDCSGQHVWLNAPFARLSEFLQHYLQCKARQPHSTSACILVPSWYGKVAASWRPMLAGMSLLHTYRKGSVLFSAPTPTGQRKVLPAIPWDVQVWYDPPVAGDLSINAVSGPVSALAMSFTGTVHDAPCTVLVDSGAKGYAYVSAQYVQSLGLQVDEHNKFAYRVADDRSATTRGTCVFTLWFGSHAMSVKAHVIDMLPEYDIILGDSWLLSNKAFLDYQRGVCSFFSAEKKRIVLKSRAFQRKPKPLPSDDPTVASLISADEWGDMVKLPSSHSDSISEHFLLVVNPVDTLPSDDSAPSVLPPALANGLDPKAIEAIIRTNESMFVSELPSGLPDLLLNREVVPIEPGAQPPCSRIWRHSPAEQKEVAEHVEGLLTKGLIQPSTSPYGAPILFAKKKDGTLRMCIDYRGINRITIKNKYPLPRIDDLLDRLQGAKYFSSLDLCSAYHQIRLVDSDVPKTAFRCHLGSYEYKVLPFGLTNAPSHFQTVINQVLGGSEGGEELRKFVCVYLDDILIFSKTPEDHLRHLNIVLKRLREHRFYVKLKKCEFNKPEVKFLGHIVSAKGVKPDPAKVQSIMEWPAPRDVSELRSFLGLANYFRKFINHYSQIAAPLTDLLKHSAWPSVLSDAALHAFGALKHALISAPVLALPDFTKPFEVLCDASIQGIGAMLLQDGHPVAYESRKLTPAERNYTTTEQELLAVIHAFRVWRCYLEGTKNVTVVTDHCPNTFFSTQAILSRRQSRWSEFLHQFTFKWLYRPGRINAADPLSRHPLHSVSAIALGPRKPIAALYLAAVSPAGRKDNMMLPECMHADIEIRIQSAYASDPWFADSHNLADLSARRGYWLKDNRIVVPDVNDLRYECVKLCHDMPWVAHLGVTKTLKMLERFFWWPSMRADVEAYVRTCDSCQRVKPRNHSPAGLLMPLPIPERPWESISMDFITCLPLTAKGFDTIMVVVDRLTKLAHFIPMNETATSETVAKLLQEHVFRLHGVPDNIVSDRDCRFTSEFFKSLCTTLGVAQHMSTAFHPESDGQTERVNRCLEDMLRHFVTPDQSNWADLLCMAEFAYNSAWHESIQTTPFYLTYGYHPSTPLKRLLPSLDQTKGAVLALAVADKSRQQRRKAYNTMRAAAQRVPAVAKFTVHMQEALQRAKRALQAARERAKHHADRHRSEVKISVGDQVLLSSKNIQFRSGGSRKLMPRFLGPFKVSQQVNPVAFKLDLQEWSTKLHPVFHASLLRPYRSDGRSVVRPPPLEVAGELEYEVESIIKRYYNRNGKLHYVVRWKGYGPESDTREPPDNLTNCPDVLREFLDKEKQGLVPEPEYAPGAKAKLAAAEARKASRPASDSVPAAGASVSAPVPASDAPAMRTRSRLRISVLFRT